MNNRYSKLHSYLPFTALATLLAISALSVLELSPAQALSPISYLNGTSGSSALTSTSATISAEFNLAPSGVSVSPWYGDSQARCSSERYVEGMLYSNSYYFEYGSGANFGSRTESKALATDFNGVVSENLTALTSATVYYYRVVFSGRIPDSGLLSSCPGATKSFTTAADTASTTTDAGDSAPSNTVSPDTVAPTVNLSLSRVRLNRSKRVLAQVSSSEAATGQVRAVVKVRAKTGKLVRALDLKTTDVVLGGKASLQVEFSLTPSVRRKLGRYLRGAHALSRTAEVVVTATVADAAGNKTTVSKEVRVR